jgi:transcription factor E2F3
LEQENQIDQFTKQLEVDLKAMAKDPVYQNFAYMTFDDIREANKDNTDTLIAIKAPIGTRIEIPDPE